MPSLPPRRVCDIVQDFMGIKNLPKGHKNDRIKGGREKAIEKSKNQKKGCNICSLTDHNRHTCPNNGKVSPSSPPFLLH